MRALGDRSSSAAATEARARCLDLVARMARVIGDWRTGRFRFVDDPTALTADLVGPLPTRRLLMVGATVGATAADLVREAGWRARAFRGRDRRVSMQDDPNDLLGFGPEEHFLLERLRQPMTLGEVAAESPLDREATMQRLAQLLVVRRIRVLERAVPVEDSAPSRDTALIQRLFSRFERDLKEEPLRLTQEEYRARVADLLARLGAMNYYELLEVDPSSTVELVQSKYELLARQVHPANEAAYGLTGLRPMLVLLFERATQAYLVLADPERRRQYNQNQAIDLSGARVTGAQREVESKELARTYFEQSQAMVARGDFHFGVELLQLAAKLDRRSEYLLALARVQVKNPKWLQRAVDSCRAALELEPHNADVRYQLGEIYEQQGDLERARAQYTAAAREDPNHLQANAKMRSLNAARAPRPEAEGGLFGRIFRRRDG